MRHWHPGPALAGRGYTVVGSDLSAKEIERARREADLCGLAIDLTVCDMRKAYEAHGTGYDLVISCDNSVPHLLTDDDLLTGQVKTRTMRSSYDAVPVARLCALMRDAGFENVKRLDDAFYQPVLVGTKPAIG